MMEHEVETHEVEGPASLLMVELVGFPEVGEVFVISEDFEVVLGAFKVVVPFFQSVNNA